MEIAIISAIAALIVFFFYKQVKKDSEVSAEIETVSNSETDSSPEIVADEKVEETSSQMEERLKSIQSEDVDKPFAKISKTSEVEEAIVNRASKTTSEKSKSISKRKPRTLKPSTETTSKPKRKPRTTKAATENVQAKTTEPKTPSKPRKPRKPRVRKTQPKNENLDQKKSE